jgi:DNA-binding NarL/FixJ family response regulator
MKRTTLILADDSPKILTLVTEIVAGEYDILATACDGHMALREARRLHPDVLVLDISMGTLSGIEVARQLRAGGCLSRIVFLTVHKDPDLVQAAMDAGGLAYVVKSCLITDLLPAIRAVIDGKSFLSAPVRTQLP